MDTPVRPDSQDPDDALIDDDVLDDADVGAGALELVGTTDPLEPIRLQLDVTSQGVRLDKVLATLLPQFSRGRLQQWIEDGRVQVDGKPAKVRSVMLGVEIVEVQPQPAAQDHAFLPEPLPLDVVHEDESLIVINKPVGLVVHPAAGNWSGTLLNGLLHRWPELGGVPRAGIVHRLDKDTSGLLVVARTLTAQTDLVRQLQERTVGREYLALVWGQPVSSGRIDAAIARHPRERTRMAVSKSPLAKPAVTHYQKVASGLLDGRPVALLRCRLETGRTHQIRVHLQSIGFPIVGDAVYGKSHLATVFPRQALHAERLGLVHPASDDDIAWHAAVPQDMAALLGRAGIRL